MGYVRKQKIYRLLFEDPEMEGLIVRARSASVGQIMEAGSDLRANTELLAECLVDWNLQRADGTPIPADLENLRAQDPPFINALIDAYSSAVFGVSGPLGQSSPGGPRSLEASMPMEPLSPSQAS